MKRISCIIFDLDGTLAQTNELIFASINHIAQKYLHKQFSPDEITKMFGPPEEVVIERLVGKENSQNALNDFFRFYELNHPSLADSYRGIKEILEFLSQNGVILTIFTGKGKRTALITLEHLGIKKYFDLIVTGNDVNEHKPSAEGICKVMSKFDLELDEVLMVGDSVADVKAAHEAGVQIAAVLWDSYGKDKVLQMEVDYAFFSTEDFMDWLRTRFNTYSGSAN